MNRVLTGFRKLQRAPFESAVAVAGISAATAYLVDPEAAERTALGKTAKVLLPYWQILFGLGGVLILIGLLRESVRIEVAGLALLAGAVLMSSVSIFHLNGVEGATSGCTLAAITLACLGRGLYLVSRWRKAPDDTPPPRL